MKRTHIMLFFLLALGLSFSCKEAPKKVIETAPVEFTKEGELTLFKAQTDSIIGSFDIEIADSDYETQTGLMYRNAMNENEAMLFIFPDEAMHSFYMKNTKIPLDIIFITKDLRIASLKENTKPLDEAGLSSEVPVQYVLEINAGLAKKLLLKVGDSISYKKN